MKIGYARVSTTDQNLEPQIDALKEAGVEEENIYREFVSGAKTNRPEWNNCKRALREGDQLIIWKLDRLGRSIIELVTIADELNRRGVHLHSLTDAIDTTTAGGTLIFNVLAAVAQFERDIISERTKAGLKAARARGARGGRPPTLDATQVKLAQKMLEDPTVTMADVARLVGTSESTVRRALRKAEDPKVMAELEKLAKQRRAKAKGKRA
ncbi:MAG: recombinase family protein [Pseudomonadota bacterium]|nr:recombinase family protein [Pseudomonadota bacterium]